MDRKPCLEPTCSGIRRITCVRLDQSSDHHQTLCGLHDEATIVALCDLMHTLGEIVLGKRRHGHLLHLATCRAHKIRTKDRVQASPRSMVTKRAQDCSIGLLHPMIASTYYLVYRRKSACTRYVLQSTSVARSACAWANLLHHLGSRNSKRSPTHPCYAVQPSCTS